MKIYEGLLKVVATVAMNIVIGNTSIRRGIETISRIVVESRTEIGSWKETRTRTGIEIMIVTRKGPRQVQRIKERKGTKA